MILKQFLKPDWRKIVLFVVLCIISFLVGIAYMFTFNYYPGPFGRTDLTVLERISYSPFGIPLLILSPLEYARKIINYYWWIPPALGQSPNPEFTMAKNLNWLIDILNFVYSYILSCLIVWIYDKVKKKN